MAYMTRMVIDAPSRPLRLTTTQIPEPAGTDVLIKVAACGVCRTDLHVADGEITARYPVVPGHEIVGRVIAIGPDATHLDIGDRVGVPWLGRTCGVCPYCRSEHENLCDQPTFTGAPWGAAGIGAWATSAAVRAWPRGSTRIRC